MRVADDEFASVLRARLADRAGTLCSNPDCRRHTKGASDEGPSAVVNVGKAAHICAASAGGPRFDGAMSSGQRSSIENSIWLCSTCHDLVDRDVIRYPAELLRRWKREHEAFIADTISGKRATLDRRMLDVLAQVLGVSRDALDANLSMSTTPPEQPLPAEVEFVASSMYSTEKDAIIVVGEVGNSSSKKITIRDVRLFVEGVRVMLPEEVLVPGAFYVEGHTWLGAAPFPVDAEGLAKVAWYFNAAGTDVGRMLDTTQPISCRLEVRCFPQAVLTQAFDLFSITRLRELSLA